jgi:murein DD-endopeptidase MepM/ murein hydrolase activator NlpD
LFVIHYALTQTDKGKIKFFNIPCISRHLIAHNSSGGVFMKNKPFAEKVGEFLGGKGFYIVLLLCVTAIGVSGYYLFSSMMTSEFPAMNAPASQVAGSLPGEIPKTETAPGKPSVNILPRPPEDKTAEPAPETAPAAASVFTWPVRGSVSRGYSLEVFAYDTTMGDWRTHSGMDIDAVLGTEVMSVASGTVSAVTQDALMGTTVVVDHGDGLQSCYAGLTKVPTVAAGDKVAPGSVLGAVGATAIAESGAPPHLHFEMKKNGAPVDPVSFLPEGN